MFVRLGLPKTCLVTDVHHAFRKQVRTVLDDLYRRIPS